MKSVLLFLLLLLNNIIVSEGKAQLTDNSQCVIVHLPNFYQEKGVVFNKDYNVGIHMKNKKNRYTPTKSDIETVEGIFDSHYNQLVGANIEVKKHFCHWVRQYVGVIDSSGERRVIVQLINNNKPRKTNRLLGKGWERTFIVMLADDFYKVSTRFSINIDTGEMRYTL